MTIHRRACPLCEAVCGLCIETDGDRVVAIRGDPDDPASRGYFCRKAHGLAALHQDPRRLRHPRKRTTRGWVDVPWDEALAEAGERLGAIRRDHGDRAVAFYTGNRCHEPE